MTGRNGVYLNVRNSSEQNSLLDGLRRGSQAAYSEAMRRYGPLVTSVVASLIADTRDAEEAVQDAFVRAFKGIGGYRPDKGSLPSWLARIAYRVALNRLRSNGVSPPESPLELLPDMPEEEPPELPADAELLQRALTRLRPEERGLLTLVYFDGLSLDDAAYVLDSTAPAISSRLYRIRKKLETIINEIRHYRQ